MAIAVGIVLLVLERARRKGLPLTLEELSHSRFAESKGIDNRVPANLRTRALGLGVVLGLLQGEGFRITSMFRTRELTAAVRARNNAAGVNTGVNVLPGPGDHELARGADVAPESGPVDTSNRAAAQAALKDLRLRVLRSSVGPLITQALVEDDHVHLRFDEDALATLGEREQAQA